MVINRVKKLYVQYTQDSILFPISEVDPCTMRLDETFKNREPIEIPVFETDESAKKNEPNAVLRGIYCQSIVHNAPTLICASGRSQNVEVIKQFIPQDIFHHMNIVLVNYRGYGTANGTDEQKARGSTGKPTSEAMEADILRVYDYVQKKYGFSKIYTVGVSLGSAIVTYLSKHRHVDAQLLIAPYDSMVRQACDFLTYVEGIEDINVEEMETILKHKFDSISNMKDNSTPTDIIRAGDDDFIRPERTLNLIKHISNMKQDIVIPKSDHSFDAQNPHVRMGLHYAIGLILSQFILESQP